MEGATKCAYCREEFAAEPILYKGKAYCSEACAFQASLKTGSICGSESSMEASLRYQREATRKS
ncbi:MAG: hypothetical protein HYU86_08635 [Chloroflexi bacterium]|nr:hypothetical protein [Chloroflexota bacterium]